MAMTPHITSARPQAAAENPAVSGAASEEEAVYIRYSGAARAVEASLCCKVPFNADYLAADQPLQLGALRAGAHSCPDPRGLALDRSQRVAHLEP